VCHADANDDNVVASADGREVGLRGQAARPFCSTKHNGREVLESSLHVCSAQAVGLIDFGDMAVKPRVRRGCHDLLEWSAALMPHRPFVCGAACLTSFPRV
jgi:hypothetical protein